MSDHALFPAAVALYQQGRVEQARQVCLQLLAKQPGHGQALQLLGTLLVQAGDVDGGLAKLRDAVAHQPMLAAGHTTLANHLLQLRRPAEAVPHYELAVRLATPSPELLNSLAVAYRDATRPADALRVLDQALAQRPTYARAHNNRGNALRDLGRPTDALKAYERAVELDPNNLLARNNHAQLLQTLGREAEAQAAAVDVLASGDQALAAGDALAALQRYEQQLRATPDDPETLNRYAVALLTLKRTEQALAAFERLLVRAPDDASAHNNAGKAFIELHRLDRALACYKRATELMPEHAPFWMFRAQTMLMMDRAEQALPLLDRVLTLDAAQPYALGARLQAQRTIADWDGADERAAQVAHMLSDPDDTRLVISPFPWLGFNDDPALHRRCAERHAESVWPPRKPLFTGTRHRAGGQRIRLGYLSADLHNHATAHLASELFERHDRSRFEVVAYSYGPARDDAMRERLVRAFDRFEDVQHLDDEAVARRLLADEVDIAIDLKGHTHLGRSGILSWRPAPVQVSWLGYPGTLGVDFIDYVIGDPHVLPPGSEVHYREHIVRLPDCYQVNDSKRPIAAQAPSRKDCGLPAEGFVFCCFNNGFKLGPEVFSVWMKLLKQVPGSVLWLLADHAAQPRHLRAAAQAQGVDPQRLVFASRLPQAEHLARHACADLFLDTLPYNAHTTASDALWAGLPVLTCRGRAFAGRVAASLLHAVGLPELVTDSLADYEALALRLAREPQGQPQNRLADLRQRLRASRDTCALFDTLRFTRHLEAAYRAMWQRHAQGLAPVAFNVTTLN